jgi:outer membrane protein OmpA-like peptidoglycan-associated protein
VKLLRTFGVGLFLWASGASMAVEAAGPPVVPSHLFAKAPAGQRLLLLYRADQSPLQTTVSYAGRMHASLERGEYTMLFVCDTDIRLGVALEPKSLGDSRSEHVVDFSSHLAAPLVVRLDIAVDQGPRFTPTKLDEVPWASLAQHTRTQSRVQLSCPTVVATVPLPVTPDKPSRPHEPSLLLSGDHVFAFGSAELNHQAADLHIRQALVRHMQETGIRKITSVAVYGHSDPVGSSRSKQEISRLRAEAVAHYLVGVLGVLTRNIHIEWRGDSQPLVANCPSTPVKTRNACNAPNRRVELFVSGTP